MRTKVTTKSTFAALNEYEIGKLYEAGPAIVLCSYIGSGLQDTTGRKDIGGGILLKYDGPYDFPLGSIYHLGNISGVKQWNGVIEVSNG